MTFAETADNFKVDVSVTREAARMKGNIRDLYGEYDPPYDLNTNPTEAQRKAAEELIAAYEALAALKKKNQTDGD